MKADIYTRGGDAGQTSLLGNRRVYKDDRRVEVYGTLDEGTSALGLARATTQFDDLCRQIIDLQGELIGVMSEAATKADGPSPRETPRVQPAQIAQMEETIDRYNQEWIQTGQFVRPGGSQAGAALDMARAIFRRAERRLITLSHEETVNPHLLQYLNRLSDLLYVLARIDEQRTIIEAVMGNLPPEISATVNSYREKAKGDAKMNLTLEACDRMVEAGMERAREIGVPMVLAVVDQNGDVIESRRMDDALIVSVTLAPHKAYTAATIRLPTAELAKAAQPGESLYGIDVNLPKITLVGGGVPLKKDDKVVGAVGVSGGSVAQDVAVAEAMVAAF
jgi:ATP:cob(I)alamin adenosyltransferase